MSDWSYARDLRARVARASEAVDPHRQFTVIERVHHLMERAVVAGVPDSDVRRIERSIKLRVARRWYAENGTYQNDALEVADRTFETVYPVVWLDAFEAALERDLADVFHRLGGGQPSDAISA